MLRQAGNKVKKIITGAVVICMCLIMTACSGFQTGNRLKEDGAQESDNNLDNRNESIDINKTETELTSQKDTEMYTRTTKITDVINDEIFGDYGRLIFPVESAYYSGDTLENLKLTWYNNIDPDTTVEIVNYMKSSVLNGQTIFYDIYSEQEKKTEPAKEDTGLFFFKGNEGGKFAVCNAGGAFAYVGAMQDSFPHALELSKKGYNAFALIYRPGAQTACEDLSRALAFISL